MRHRLTPEAPGELWDPGCDSAGSDVPSVFFTRGPALPCTSCELTVRLTGPPTLEGPFVKNFGAGVRDGPPDLDTDSAHFLGLTTS